MNLIKYFSVHPLVVSAVTKFHLKKEEVVFLHVLQNQIVISYAYLLHVRNGLHTGTLFCYWLY
jgi:hypothetical protein